MTSDMRTLTLDAQAIALLESLGFVIGDNGESAHVAGAIAITVERCVDLTEYEFQFRIMLPSGVAVTCFARRPALLDAAALPIPGGAAR